MDEQLQLAKPDQLAEASLAVIWYRRAVLMMVISAVINSTGGLLVRSIESASDWQLIFWRGGVLAVAITGIVIFQYGKTAVPVFRQIGYLGLVAGLFYSGTVIFYILSVTHTTIANAVFTLSAIPFFTAFIAWVVLGERITITTAVAILCALGGIALMVGDGMAAGSVFGNVMAIAASVCFACFVVILRKKRSINMLPATAVGSLIAAMVAVFATSGDLQVSMHDLAICFTWGAVISSAGHFLVVTSSRHLGGAELTLLILIEFVLAPIWVWLLINEVPGMMTLAGGAIVLFAVAGHAMFSMRGFGRVVGL